MYPVAIVDGLGRKSTETDAESAGRRTMGTVVALFADTTTYAASLTQVGLAVGAAPPDGQATLYAVALVDCQPTGNCPRSSLSEDVPDVTVKFFVVDPATTRTHKTPAGTLVSSARAVANRLDIGLGRIVRIRVIRATDGEGTCQQEQG